MSSEDMPVVWYSGTRGGQVRYWLRLQGRYDITRPAEQEEIAELCAADFHSNHDGWECRWPRQFTLYASDVGPALAVFDVDREAEPVFYASPAPLAADAKEAR